MRDGERKIPTAGNMFYNNTSHNDVRLEEKKAA
jgi:hypothetical protein